MSDFPLAAVLLNPAAIASCVDVAEWAAAQAAARLQYGWPCLGCKVAKQVDGMVPWCEEHRGFACCEHCWLQHLCDAHGHRERYFDRGIVPSAAPQTPSGPGRTEIWTADERFGPRG